MSSGGNTRPFVGRSEELATIARALEDAKGGHTRVVVITGDAGIGKTALAVEVTAQAGARVAFGVLGKAAEHRRGGFGESASGSSMKTW